MDSKTEKIVQEIFQMFIDEGFTTGQQTKDNMLAQLTCQITAIKIDMRDGNDVI